MPARGADKENVDVRKARISTGTVGPYVPPVTSPIRAKIKPRKSAIRANPQVFESPTSLGPNPEHKHVSIGAPASDIVALVERTARQELEGLGLPMSPGLPNPFARRAASVSPSRQAHTISLPTQPSPGARKRRRVTFSAHQHKTDFVQDEPTMHIRPAFIGSPERQVLPVHSSSDVSIDSESSSDMSMDMTAASIPTIDIDRTDNLSVRSTGSDMQMTTAFAPDVSAQSDESDMQFTQAWRPRDGNDTQDMSAVSMDMTHSLNMDLDVSGASAIDDVQIDHKNVIDDSYMSVGASDMDESAMEMTQVWSRAEREKRESMGGARTPQAAKPVARTPQTAKSAAATPLLSSRKSTSKSASPRTKTGRAGPAPASPKRTPKAAPAARPSVSARSPDVHSRELPFKSRAASPERSPSPTLSIRASPHNKASSSPRASPNRVGHRTCLESPRTPRVHSPVRIARSNNSTPAPRPASPQSHLMSPRRDSQPAQSASPSTPHASPSRFRQSLRGGVPSPGYEHSPPRRERTPPATPRRRSGGTPFKPRSPFISSIMRQRAHGDYSADDIDVSVDEASFHMSLSEFLSVVGLKFHEDMTASRQRPVLPLDLETMAARRQNRASVPLVSHAKIAAGAAPMLVTLRNACAELQQHVEDGRERLRIVEDAFYARPPAFVQEWGQLEDEDMRRSMKGQLNVHKQAARAAAMHDYYGWRTDTQFDDELVSRLAQHRTILQRSARHVDEANKAFDADLPVIRARHAELRRLVSTARSRHAEIEACDKSELRQLHASIEEQEQVLQSMRSKCVEAEEQLARVHTRIEEAGEKRASIEAAIKAARAVCEQIRGCSPGEAMRLQRRIAHIERLFQWRLESSTATLLQLTHAGALHVAIELEGRARSVRRVVVSPAGLVESSPLHVASVGLVRAHLKKHVPRDVPGVLQAVSARWLACRRVRSEIDHLKAHIPVRIIADKQSELSVALVATLLFVRQVAKADVRIALDIAAEEPFGQVDVAMVYGDLDADAIAQDISGAIDSSVHGGLTSALLGARDAHDL
ncbi:hypothetical protein MCUN1_000760 [Malassezia cuniculi]|uniref:Spc7 kinetochore protein domain-containing protein n=1 Tax=Malassezia cuniculi TaxID=948313 RepID=A0AAF0ESB5_9BASI|nr:hypothetical protein MCUN1_000760 [Malassezia cuniculi]